MDITVTEIRPTGEFGGHIFEYDRGDDLFKCVNPGCGIYEIVARANAKEQGIGEITPCPAASGTTDAPATTAVGGQTPFPADAHTGWPCDAGASLIAEAWHRPGPGRLGTLHGVIYVCLAHQADVERRISGADLSPEVHPAPPDHRHDPWPCGHITIYDTEGESLRRDTPPGPPATAENTTKPAGNGCPRGCLDPSGEDCTASLISPCPQGRYQGEETWLSANDGCSGCGGLDGDCYCGEE